MCSTPSLPLDYRHDDEECDIMCIINLHVAPPVKPVISLMMGRRSLALSLVSLGLCSAFRAPAARAVAPRAPLATSSNAAAPEGPPPLRVGIIGAGPAGLSVALCLRQLLGEGGVELAIFDRSDQLRPALGGGVQLNSGAAVLARLG